jgi:Tol biopolymer transport system component
LVKLGKNIGHLGKLCIFFLAGLFVSEGQAQFYNGSNMTFGKNRVQYNEFLWTFYKFDDFDAYFYRNGKELAEFASRYAVEQIPKMENKMESRLDKKIQFIIFNNLTDLKQSNIGLMTNESYNTGGITHIIGSKVFLYFNGNHVHFEDQIRAGIAEVLFNQMMFGGSLGQQVKTSTFFSMPDWYRVGIISYLSNEWDSHFDNRIRDGILSGRYNKVNNLKGNDAVYAGHSLWRYIANQYGKAAVSNIIHMTSVSNSIDKGFLYVIGVPFKSLIEEWRQFYEKQFEGYEDNINNPSNVLPIRYKEEVAYGQPQISPYGKYLAYTTNEMGKYKIFLYDMVRGKKKRIFKRGVMMDTKTDYSYPLLAWHPTGKLLAYMIEHQGRPWLHLYNLETKKTARQPIYEVQKITDMAYADNGKFMVMSAVRQGQSDLYVFNIAASSFERLTDDIYTELNPRFINNSSQIVFSSNRLNDTLEIVPEVMDDVPDKFDLFVYDYVNRSEVLKRITDTPLSDELQPESVDFNTISYLSDENGIFNGYLAVIDSTVSSVDTTINYRYFVNSKPVTDYTFNISDHHVSSRAGKNAFVYYNDNLFKIYYDDIPDFTSVQDMTLEDTKYQAGIRKEYEKELAKQKAILEREKAAEAKEAAAQEQEKEEPVRQMKHFQMVYLDSNGNEVVGKPKSTRVKKGTKGRTVYEVFVDDYQIEGEELEIPKRLNYRTEYFLNDVISQIDFNYINYSYQPFTGGGGPIYLNPGFNVFFQIGVNDLMEDHRFVGGVRLNFSLVNNEYIFSYANLKKRLDKEIIFHRNTLEGSNGFALARVHTHELFYMLKWPFNEALSLRGTAIFRNDMFVTMATDQFTLEVPTRYDFWAGVKGELVFDNTRSPAMNIYYGTRWKVFAEYLQLVNATERNLFVVGFDIRKYTRIHRTFIWANRLAGSASLGNENLIYYMGGVDNWLFPRFDTETPIDYDQNYAFQTLATNMRGFNQNIRNGTSFVVFNTELRFPIFQYFAKSPISSSFLRNFQLVAFGDVGTAWTGPTPYSPENSLFTRYVQSGPLNISVEIQKEPFVGGFGVGARLHLLGYFIRGDVAWGVDDYRVRTPVYYLSLSLDF